MLLCHFSNRETLSLHITSCLALKQSFLTKLLDLIFFGTPVSLWYAREKWIYDINVEISSTNGLKMHAT